ncbi:MAG: SDR family NAD(P)-dependent oxidoreductase [Hyphomonadaceae bacterium]
MKDKVVVVTGAFGALGRAVADAAAVQGARVAAIDFAPPPGLALNIGADAFVEGGVNLADEAHAARVFGAIAQKYGRIDALANIAGGFSWSKVADAPADLWDRLNTINLKTALNASRAALTHGVSAILNVGANGALKAAPGMGPYAASKSAVHRLTEALAEEHKEAGVRVNAVLPSILDTPANRADMPDADFTKWVAPGDLAGIILFLLSDDANPITGALIPVTGRV